MNKLRNSIEKIPKSALAFGVVGAFTLVSCSAGEPEPGTPPAEDSITYVYLPDVLDPDGEPVKCVYTNSSGSNAMDPAEENPWAFAAIACDFEGVADFTGRVESLLEN